MRERSGRQDVPERSGPGGLARLACMVSTAMLFDSRDLLSHGERETEHLSPRPLTKLGGRGEKVWGGVVVGLKILGREAASSLRTQARTFFPGQGRATRRANDIG